MKTYLLALPFMLGLRPALAQIPGRSVLEFTTKAGTAFHLGDTLHLALGTDSYGAFKYIVIPANGWVGTPRRVFGPSFANQRLVIKDLRVQDTNKRLAPRTVAVVNATGGLNAAVDLEAAEEVGELKTVHNQVKLPAMPNASVPSVADELLKLKGLLDAGALTQAEFDAQKTKLLTGK